MSAASLDIAKAISLANEYDVQEKARRAPSLETRRLHSDPGRRHRLYRGRP